MINSGGGGNRFSVRKCDNAKMPVTAWARCLAECSLRATAEHVRCSVHQDFLSRRRDPSHAGGDRGAAKSPKRGPLLGGRGRVGAAPAAACRRRYGHPGG